MSDYTPCCGNPATCQSTARCITRVTYRENAKQIVKPVAQAVINAITHGSKNVEADPNGLSVHTPGAKADAGKVRVGLVMSGFARALMEVAKVGTSGANKYTANGWMDVSEGIARYTDARDRHQLKEYMGEEYDTDSFKDAQYLHAAHECWNSLARLELILREKEKVHG